MLENSTKDDKVEEEKSLEDEIGYQTLHKRLKIDFWDKGEGEPHPWQFFEITHT